MLSKLIRMFIQSDFFVVQSSMESWRKDEGFVEDVNNLLNTGEIPNLFPAEETWMSGTGPGCEMLGFNT